MLRQPISPLTAYPDAVSKRTHNTSVLCVIAAAAAVAGCNAEASKPKGQGAAIQPVQIMTVSFETAEVSRSFTGTVRPRFESDVSFRVAGKIVSRHVDVGQIVEPSQLIAKLDETDFELAVKSQEAELRAALTSREQAVAAEGRFKTLLALGHVATAAFEQRKAAADEARARVDRAERSLEIAKNQLSYANLAVTTTAPSAGASVVMALSAEVGQVVAAGQPVAKLARLAELEVAVAIPEHLASEVARATAKIAVWNAPDQRIPAKLRELSPEADRVTRTYQARFSLPPGTTLELGRTATVHLSVTGAETTARIPLSALINDGRSPHVYVLDGDTRVKRRPVAVASVHATHALVTGGLQSGEKIVAMGVHRLDEGQPVRVVDHRTRSE